MKIKPDKFIEIHFGAMSPKFKTQLNKQGFEYNSKLISDLQKQSERILHLWFGKILTDKQKGVCLNKIFNRIKSNVNKINSKKIKL